MEKSETFNVNGQHFTLAQLMSATKMWLDALPIVKELAILQPHELPYRVPPLSEAAYQLLTFDKASPAIDPCQPKTP